MTISPCTEPLKAEHRTLEALTEYNTQSKAILQLDVWPREIAHKRRRWPRAPSLIEMETDDHRILRRRTISIER